MNLYQSKIYINHIKCIASQDLPWDILKNTSIIVTGATGMIGSFLIDVLMYKNMTQSFDCTIYAISRNKTKLQERFCSHLISNNLKLIANDINEAVLINTESIDFIFHLASNTHPIAYSTDPIGTILTNIIGTCNLLDFAVSHNTKRFIFASSVEIYGENRGDCDAFTEDYCGYLNSNTLRAGYPESKRAGEALCQAYIHQKSMDIIIPRLSRVFGPTMLMSDTKALSQFIKNGISGRNIVLKSDGTQFYSYIYVADAVSALLFCLFYGTNGEAYNIADEKSNISLRELSTIIADYVGRKVVFEIPSTIESAGYSKATKAVLSSNKLRALGWCPLWNIKTGLEQTIDILKDNSQSK